MIEPFLIITAVVFTAFGWYVGKKSGIQQGIEDTVDNLVEQGYLKYKGIRSNPDILKYDED
jgi:hypothetical protein|tara:strand:+ start:425 stop:607 length:183 start_codon:yes stop_codon:yes gene_type:complete